MRILVTGGSGVLGRVLVPALDAGGHDVVTPSREALDLFSPVAVRDALEGADVLYHLATRIPSPLRMRNPKAWADNDRLRTDASRVLVDAALDSSVRTYVVPTIALVYPPGPADEGTPIGEVAEQLRSALVAEDHAARFAQAGRTGVALRLGLLHGPGTRTPRVARLGPPLHIEDAGAALVAALDVPSGVYNVVEDGNRVSNARFKHASGWRPRHGPLDSSPVADTPGA